MITLIKDNQKYFNRLHVVLDGVVIVGSYLLAYFIRLSDFVMDVGDDVGVLPMSVYLTALCFIVPGYLFLYSQFDLYSSKRYSSRKRAFYNIVKANTVGTIAFLVTLYIINNPYFSRTMIFIFYAANILLTSAVRDLVRYMLHTIRKKGYNQKHILLVGYSRAAEQYIDRLRMNPQWGYEICGVLDDRIPAGTLYKEVKVLGRIDNLEVILPENKLDEIAITLSLEDYDRLEEIVNDCEKSGVHTKFIPDYNSVIPSRPYTEDLNGLPVVNIRHVPLTNTVNAFMKRVVDIIGSLFAIVLFSPVMVISAVIIKHTDHGPIIYSQERVGLHNKGFKMYKFRSMEIQKPSDEKMAWTVKNDPRVTPYGKFMRKVSIDELPQLFNVLRGEMSLIGPRPERPKFVEKFREEVPRYMIKHQVRPGMTGWAQVNGYRGDTSIRKRIEYDLYYIENWSMAFDIKILILTFFKGFINKNAY